MGARLVLTLALASDRTFKTPSAYLVQGVKQPTTCGV